MWRYALHRTQQSQAARRLALTLAFPLPIVSNFALGKFPASSVVIHGDFACLIISQRKNEFVKARNVALLIVTIGPSYAVRSRSFAACSRAATRKQLVHCFP